MNANYNTKRDGFSFDSGTVQAVWEKGKSTNDINLKQDKCGAIIQRGKYGKMEDYGWEIDHIVPVSKGGTDNLINLQPLHWENNRKKGDNLDGDWTCSVTN